MPKLSLVTAIKDGFPMFAETLPSVLGQSERDWEWLIVDDGSSTPLQDAFPILKQDSRIKVRREEQSQGQTKGLNWAIRESQSPWIVRMDGDDLCHRERLKLLLGALQRHPSLQLIFSDYRVIDQNGITWAEVRFRKPLTKSFFHYLEKKNNPICHPTVAFHKFSKDGTLRLYPEGLSNAQDYALWKEILVDAGPGAFHCISESTLEYRVVASSLSGERAPEQAAELAAIRRSKTKAALPTKLSLNEREKIGMQAYRLLFYRFVSRGQRIPGIGDLKLLWESHYYRGNMLKALLFFFGRPAKQWLRDACFPGVYDES